LKQTSTACQINKVHLEDKVKTLDDKNRLIDDLKNKVENLQ
jgi:hypothetical protein